MKVAADRGDAFCRRPDAKTRLIVVYGPDEGLVRERVRAAMASVVPDLNDPFLVAELTGAQIKAEPARLRDEAAALALTGGRRVVRVRDPGEDDAKPFQAFLDAPQAEALVVVQAGDLGPRSALRKLAEAAPGAAAVACYLDDPGAVEAVIRQTLGGAGITPDADAVAFLVEHLGGDRLVTRSELDKLTLYLGEQGRLTLDDAIACVGDTSALNLDDLVYATAEGRAREALHLLDRLSGEGRSPVAVLGALARHFQRLHLVAGQVAHGHRPEQVVDGLKPPLFFKMKGRFIAQVRRWPVARVESALEILLTADMDCRSTGSPAEALCARAIMQIARAALARG